MASMGHMECVEHHWIQWSNSRLHTKALRAPPSFLHRGAVAARVVRIEVKAYSKIFTVFISNVAVDKQEGGAGWGLQISVLLAIYLVAALAVQLAEGRLGARFP